MSESKKGPELDGQEQQGGSSVDYDALRNQAGAPESSPGDIAAAASDEDQRRDAALRESQNDLEAGRPDSWQAEIDKQNGKRIVTGEEAQDILNSH
jgi:hypothetical protein